LASFDRRSSSRQYFHRHFAVQLQIGGAIDDAHAAAADFTVEAIPLTQYRPRHDRTVDDCVAAENGVACESSFICSPKFQR
jgi:hypothetical protein